MIIEIIAPLLAHILIPIPPEQKLEYTVESHIEIATPEPLKCNCVRYLREMGVELPVGDLKFTPTTQEPLIGSVAIFYYPHSNLYHVAVVTKVGLNWFVVKESNYNHCQVGTRIVDINDPSLVGFRNDNGSGKKTLVSK